MKHFISALACATAALLAGCLSSSGPLWLQSGNVKMETYANQQVIVLPVATANGVDIQRGDLVVLQGQITAALKSVFDLRKIEIVQNEGPPTGPYTVEDLAWLADTYRGAAALVAITVFDERRDSSANINSRNLQIVFADAKDPKGNWTISREYRSGSGFDADSMRFSTSVTADFLTTRDRLAAAKGPLQLFTPNQYAKPDAPRVYVNLPADLDSQVRGANGNPQAVIETSQDLLFLKVDAKDAGGLRETVITNSSSKTSKRLVHTLDPDEPVKKVIETVEVPLEPGQNDIELVTTNMANRPTRHSFAIRLTPKSVVNALGVAIGKYPMLGEVSGVNEHWLTTVNASGSAEENHVAWLRDSEATAQSIRLHLYDAGLRTVTNEKSIGLFYFTGKAVAEKSGTYLATYDSKQGLVPVTSIDVRSLADLLPYRGSFVMLDLCEKDPYVQTSVRAAVSKLNARSAISFTSCEGSTDSLSTRLITLRNEGKSLKDSIQQVVNEQSRPPLRSQ